MAVGEFDVERRDGRRRIRRAVNRPTFGIAYERETSGQNLAVAQGVEKLLEASQPFAACLQRSHHVSSEGRRGSRAPLTAAFDFAGEHAADVGKPLHTAGELPLPPLSLALDEEDHLLFQAR